MNGNTQKAQDWFLKLEREMKKRPVYGEETDRAFRRTLRLAAREAETETAEILEKVLSKTRELLILGEDDETYMTFIMEEVTVLLTHTNPTIRTIAAAVVASVITDATKTNRIKVGIKWL